MSGTVLADRNEPEPGRSEQAVDLQASAALAEWLRDHPPVERELQEAGRAHVHLQELQVRSRVAESVATAAERQAANTAMKMDPAGHRVLSSSVGATLVALLVILDIMPLNWAAQAFGLNAAGSWLVTGILLVASVAAMA